MTWTIALLIFISSCVSFLNSVYFGKLLLHPVSIFRSNEYYRLFTADFVHNDMVHLVLNEAMLILVCGKLEKLLRATYEYGSLKFLVVYLASMLFGTVAVTIIHRSDFDFSGAGASGSILGCMFCYTILKPEVTALYLPLIGAIPNKCDALIYILGLIVYKLRGKNSMINHELHFFGALGGILVTFVLFPGVI
ncbi:rhomboid family intramembrane serine protease [Mucilaginibacter yixingensis]|nr:rhomboid family intramembrane serine protease [Mucilaginibacter yixingensis]